MQPLTYPFTRTGLVKHAFVRGHRRLPLLGTEPHCLESPRRPLCSTLERNTLLHAQASARVRSVLNPLVPRSPLALSGQSSISRGALMVFQLTLNQAWLQSTHSRNVRSKNRRSLYPAIHVTSRILLRSSSTHEPNDPPRRVIQSVFCFAHRSRTSAAGPMRQTACYNRILQGHCNVSTEVEHNGTANTESLGRPLQGRTRGPAATLAAAALQPRANGPLSTANASDQSRVFCKRLIGIVL